MNHIVTKFVFGTIVGLVVCTCVSPTAFGNTVTLSNLVLDKDSTDPYTMKDTVVVVANPNTSTVYYSISVYESGSQNPYAQVTNIPLKAKNSEFHTLSEYGTGKLRRWGGFYYQESGSWSSLEPIEDTIPWPFNGSIVVSSTSTIKAYAYANGTWTLSSQLDNTCGDEECDPRMNGQLDDDVEAVWDYYAQNLDHYLTTYDSRAAQVVPWVDIWEYGSHENPNGWELEVRVKNMTGEAVELYINCINSFTYSGHDDWYSTGWLYIDDVPAGHYYGEIFIPGLLSFDLMETLIDIDPDSPIFDDADYRVFGGIMYVDVSGDLLLDRAQIYSLD
ncbi:MAG TPA: hypothetical protein PKG76_15825 [Acidobacteriota bacterium]|nr:hypothetical protein [Acidobacteriota bacterium]